MPSSVATSSPKIVHHIDQPLQWKTLPRCLAVHGWCFAAPGYLVQAIRLKTPNLTVGGVIGKSRPDVKTALPDAPDEHTGFQIHAVLPPGRLELSIEVQLNDGSWHPLFSAVANVRRRWQPLWLGGGDWPELLFSQAPCQMQYPPRALVPGRFPASKTKPGNRPKLSIVTPSFQQARFLPETVRSVLEQAEVNCEYVVQDGGSTDGSTEIIARVAQDQQAANAHSSLNNQTRLISWVSEPDIGQADAIAKGFAKTSGRPDDLMAWINSDDFYLPGALAFVADFFAQNPDVDVIYGHRLLVDENSREMGRWFLPKHEDEVLKLYDFFPQETMFWRRRIWDKAGGLDPTRIFAMDWDLLLRFQAAGAQIERVPYFLACFRIHSGQKTSSMMETTGQQEIDALRFRTHRRHIPPAEIEANPTLLRFLRQSAWLRFLWQLGIRR